MKEGGGGGGGGVEYFLGGESSFPCCFFSFFLFILTLFHYSALCNQGDVVGFINRNFPQNNRSR